MIEAFTANSKSLTMISAMRLSEGESLLLSSCSVEKISKPVPPMVLYLPFFL
jgi:hypothetical protein